MESVEERPSEGSVREALAEAKAAAAHMRSVLMQAPALIAVTRGPEHVFELVNPLYESTFARPGLQGKRLVDAFPEVMGQAVVGLLDRVYETGETFAAEEYVVHLDRGRGGPEPCYFSFVVQPIRSAEGRTTGLISHAVEVTEQVKTRLALEQAVQARDLFLSIASHELKTPITALQLQVQALLRQSSKGIEPLSARTVERAQTIARVIDRIGRLIDELLDVSRLSAGRLQLQREWFDLVGLVKEVIARTRPQLDKSGCTLETLLPAVPVDGLWDRFRLEQIVTNLLTNAAKYGAHAPVHISVLAGDPVTIRVEDHGIGIAAEDQARIFQRFERAVAPQHYGGFGLGLWIARQIVEAHHGEISVQSEVGLGSVFTVKLPVEI